MNSNYSVINNTLSQKGILLVAVTKTRPAKAILELYNAGHRDFGENRVQELREKEEILPKDINWHLIGHLQSNKVKYIAPFVHLIHSVDSFELLIEINKQAIKNDRIISCLLQIHIATEETKFGLSEEEVFNVLNNVKITELKNIRISGLMGMATNTDDKNLVRSEFRTLKILFDKIKSEFFSNDDSFDQISMGMSSDYTIAMEEGTTMVRIGSLLW